VVRCGADSRAAGPPTGRDLVPASYREQPSSSVSSTRTIPLRDRYTHGGAVVAWWIPVVCLQSVKPVAAPRSLSLLERVASADHLAPAGHIPLQIPGRGANFPSHAGVVQVLRRSRTPDRGALLADCSTWRIEISPSAQEQGAARSSRRLCGQTQWAPLSRARSTSSRHLATGHGAEAIARRTS
jgi:hypothetical protein